MNPPDDDTPGPSDVAGGALDVKPPGTEPSAAETSPSDRTSLGRVAALLRRRTLDLVAIGILLAAGLTFATRLSNWWDREPDDLVFTPNESPLWAWNEPGEAIEIVFGEADFALHREIVTGTSREAIDRLVETTATLVAQASDPSGEPDESARQLAAAARRIEPRWRSADERTSVHVSLLPMPMAIGLRRAAENGDPAGTKDDDDPFRVVCWGMLLGGDTDRWTAYWFEPRTTNGGAADGGVDLPPGAVPTVRILDRQGVGVVGFRGPGTVAEWREHFDSRYPSEAHTTWIESNETWTTRYELDDGRTVDVRFTERGGSCDGIVEIHRVEVQQVEVQSHRTTRTTVEK